MIRQFDPDCFQYILDFWAKAQDDFYGTESSPGLFTAQSNIPLNPVDTTQNPLFLTKQAIIVLREELEYFSITKQGALARTDIITGLPNDELREVKRQCGRALEDRTSIFTALQRNVNKENNLAEQHLIDMLCMRWVSRGLPGIGAVGLEPCEGLKSRRKEGRKGRKGLKGKAGSRAMIGRGSN